MSRIPEFTLARETRTLAKVLSHTDAATIVQGMIAQRAYSIWQSRGQRTGTSLQDWLEAEEAVMAEIRRARRSSPGTRE